MLEFEIEGYERNPDPIRYFKRAEAVRAKRIIVGLIETQRQEIDLTKIDKEDALKKLEEVGASGEIEKKV
jgi:cell fate (sporulation/competence/biofilm development) regulator YmcA (YheA/YmcA/DUF963 family)